MHDGLRWCTWTRAEAMHAGLVWCTWCGWGYPDSSSASLQTRNSHTLILNIEKQLFHTKLQVHYFLYLAAVKLQLFSNHQYFSRYKKKRRENKKEREKREGLKIRKISGQRERKIENHIINRKECSWYALYKQVCPPHDSSLLPRLNWYLWELVQEVL